MILASTLLFLTIAAPAHSEPGTVVLRNGRVIQAQEVEATDQSLSLVVDGRELVYGWHDISEVRGSAQGDAAGHMPIAETSWRGLSRLNRGDRVAAEPALETAFLEVGREVGLTAAAVSKGLLECRVSRGALALAVEPFLYVLLNDTDDGLPDGFDPELKLCESLPPIWGNQAGLSAMVTEISANEFSAWQANERANQLARLYATAAIHEISGRAPVPSLQPADEGVRLIQEMVVSRVGSESEREEARIQLAARLNLDIPDWQSAWIHASLGLSLLIEQDDRSSRLGIVQLLHVPSMFGDSQPYLAGVCLSRAALQLEAMGRRDAAVKLAKTFQKDFGRHDAGDMPGMEQLMQGEQGDSQQSRSDKEGV